MESKSCPPFEQVTEISVWERLGKAAMLNIESAAFSWDMLSSLHHTEHSSSNEHSEDESNKALEVFFVYFFLLHRFRFHFINFLFVLLLSTGDGEFGWSCIFCTI